MMTPALGNKNHWRPLIIGVTIAIILSLSIIYVVSGAVRKVSDAVEHFGFYSFREIHITLLDVTRLSDGLYLAQTAPSSAAGLAHLTEVNDLAYIRFVTEDRSALIDIVPRYAEINRIMVEIVGEIDEVLTKGSPLDVKELAHIQNHVDNVRAIINDIYYVHGASINRDVEKADQRLENLSIEISVTLALFSALSIIMVILLVKRHEAAGRLRYQANHDALTGLKNRAWLVKNSGKMFGDAHASENVLQLFLIDLDRFKQVNDIYGHHVGDALLVHVAEQLVNISVEGKIVPIRLGGDEMALLAIVDDDDFAAQLQLQVHACLNNPEEIAGHRLRLSASVGVASYPEHGTELDALMRNADIALYKAKNGGRGRMIIYDPQIMGGSDQNSSFHTKVREAISAGEFELVWQPIFNLRDASLSGAEAFLRWNDSESGRVLMPDEFLPIAEQSDVIDDIDRMVLSETCAAAARWELELEGEFVISVNVSTHHLQNQDFPEYLANLARRVDLNPQRLEVDLNESLFVADRNLAFKIVGRLRELGFRVALDDFGKGMIDLRYLADLEVDRLKIDSSFIDQLENSEKKQAMVRSIIAAGRCANAKIVAEGVETQEQMSFLIDNDCDFAQGHLFARPTDSATFRNYLQRNIGKIAAASGDGGKGEIAA